MVIALLIGIIYVFGLPLGLFNYDVAGNNIFYMFNMILASAICIILVKALYPGWRFGFQLKGFVDGLSKYGWTGFVGAALILICSYYAFRPFVKTPTVGVILIWVIIYCFLVALIEELLLRGLLLNTLLKGFQCHKQGIIMAILVSNIFFGLGHIPGMLQYSIGLIIAKLAWTIGLGIYLACVYVLTDSLWTVITIHWVVDVSGSIFYYFSSSQNPYANALGALIIFWMLAVIGLVHLAKKNHLKECKNNIKLS